MLTVNQTGCYVRHEHLDQECSENHKSVAKRRLLSVLPRDSRPASTRRNHGQLRDVPGEPSILQLRRRRTSSSVYSTDSDKDSFP